MCNLYSMRKPRDEAARSFRAMIDRTGNQPPLPAIFPDQLAPVIRVQNGAREMLNMRWGFPCPPTFGARPVTNVRNVNSPHWRAWLTPEFRCLVPATSFCEYNDLIPKVPHWFALDDTRPFFAFAGIWRRWRGVRGPKRENPVEEEHLLFSFLTTAANEIVRPVHAQAMPAILTNEEEWATWLSAPAAEALALQRPLLDDALTVVMTGERQDDFEPA